MLVIGTAIVEWVQEVDVEQYGLEVGTVILAEERHFKLFTGRRVEAGPMTVVRTMRWLDPTLEVQFLGHRAAECAVLECDSDRCLIFKPAPSTTFNVDGGIVYADSDDLTVESCDLLCWRLGANRAILPWVDVLFASHRDDATDLARSPKICGARPRIVVVTNGRDPTLVASNDHLLSFPVEPLPPDLLTDLNGAGDAFRGGFLAQFLRNKDVAAAVRAGHFAARTIIQHSASTLPDHPPTFTLI